MENEIRYFSMFTGVGGFELGFKGANALSITSWDKSWGNEEDRWSIKSVPMATQQFTCVGMSEIDKYACELLKKRFPNTTNYGDCTKINPNGLPDFDMLCGGFPCQTFSIAGRRQGFNDTRGTMFYEIVRILKVKRPKIILLENVKGLLSHDRGRTFAIIISNLTELGYDVQWMVLNSKFFGVPQNRERVFIIGSLRNEPRSKILPFRETISKINEEYKGTRQIIQIDDVGRENKHKLGDRLKEDGATFTLNSIEQRGIIEPKIMDLYNKKEHSNRSPALTEPHHNTIRVREGMRIRKLTPIECERLQGFPEGWTEGFSDTQRYKMMGNAVTVNVIKAIAERIL